MIELKNVSKTYHSSKVNVEALKNVSLKIEDKGFTFIVGKSGCGKTTLLNVIGTLDSFDSGEILFNNKSLKGYTEAQIDDFRNDNLGFVFQEYNLIDGYNVEKNISLALNLQSINNTGLVDEVLKTVGLEGYSQRKVSELSGGQKQRVAIARALVKKPNIILADEPTGNLDSATSVEILELLKELSKEICVIVVSHNRDDASKYADKIIELKDGEIISTQIINDGNLKENTIIKSEEKSKQKHLPITSMLNISFNCMKKRWIRLSMVIIVFTLSLVSVLFCLASVVNDPYDILVKNCVKYDETISIRKNKNMNNMSTQLHPLTNENIQSIKVNNPNYDYIEVYGTNSEYPYFETESKYISYNQSILISTASLEQMEALNYEMVCGVFPTKVKEAVITLHEYYMFKELGIKDDLTGEKITINNYDDIINKKIAGYYIVGIIDTKVNNLIIDGIVQLDEQTKEENLSSAAEVYFYDAVDYTIHQAMIVLPEGIGQEIESIYSTITNGIYYMDTKYSAKSQEYYNFQTDEDIYTILSNEEFESSDQASIIIPYRELDRLITYLHLNYIPRQEEETKEYFNNNDGFYSYFGYPKNVNNSIGYCTVKIVGFQTFDDKTIIVNNKTKYEYATKTYKTISLCTKFKQDDYKGNISLLDNLNTSFTEDEVEYHFVAVSGFQVSIEDMLFELNGSSSYKTILAMGSVFAFISILLIWNFVYTTIIDNKKTIGILRAVGTKKKEIAFIYIIEPIFIAIISSILMCLSIFPINIFFCQYDVIVPTIYFNFWKILVVITFSFVVVGIGSMFTIIKMIRQKPVDLIRKEI